MPVALQELKDVMGKKRAFIVTDSFLYKNGYTKPITDKLDEMGIVYTTFADVEPDPSLISAQKGAEAMRKFEPDVIIALGGGSARMPARLCGFSMSIRKQTSRIWLCVSAIFVREFTHSLRWVKRLTSSLFQHLQVQVLRYTIRSYHRPGNRR